VLSGPVTACRPAGALWEISIRTAEAFVVTVRLHHPAPVGEHLVVTAVDPPRFGPDGEARQ
jgi:hypothetical protein